MNSENSWNSASTNSQTTSHRKRKRRKWKKCLSSNVEDLQFVAGASNDLSTRYPGKGTTWFWSNYHKALEWQGKHEVALWKSYALGLQQENRLLMTELQKQFPGRTFNTPLTLHNLEKSVETPCKIVNKINAMKSDIKLEERDFECDGIEFEMSEEMIKFFEQSIKHKLEMKKLKAKECDSIDMEVKELKESHDEREKEMKLLYGDGSSMIIGMETAVQLSFDKYCDLKSPKYWPNIPLKL